MENKNLSAFAYYSGDERRDIPGLTKREYFAAMAMQGILANRWCLNHFNGKLEALDPAEASKQSIMFADALLNQLDKQEP